MIHEQSKLLKATNINACFISVAKKNIEKYYKNLLEKSMNKTCKAFRCTANCVMKDIFKKIHISKKKQSL